MDKPMLTEQTTYVSLNDFESSVDPHYQSGGGTSSRKQRLGRLSSWVTRFRKGDRLESESTYASINKATIRRRWRRVRSRRTIAALTWISLAVVACAIGITMATNLILDNMDSEQMSFFDPVDIGGTLTLAQAKAVDFFSSAVAIPIWLGTVNVCIFYLVRTTVIDERNGNVSVLTLTEIASTTFGTYNPLKAWRLLASREIRAVLAAFVTLAAAAAYSLLTNIVSLEAYDFFTGNGTKTLSYLYAPPLVASNCTIDTAWFSPNSDILCPGGALQAAPKGGLLPELTNKQVVAFTQNLDGLKSSLRDQSYRDVVGSVGNVSYSVVGINASEASLDTGWPGERGPATVENVPIWLIQANCTPYHVSSFGFAKGNSDTQALTYFTVSDNDTSFSAILPFDSDNLGKEGYQHTVLPVIAFPDHNAAGGNVILGTILPGSGYNGSVFTDFGPTTSLGFNLGHVYTNSSSTLQDTMISFSGISCYVRSNQFIGSIFNSSDNGGWIYSDGPYSLDYGGANATYAHAQSLNDSLLTSGVPLSPLLRQLQFFDSFQNTPPYAAFNGLGSNLAVGAMQNRTLLNGTSQPPTYSLVDLTGFATAFIYAESAIRSSVYNVMQADATDPTSLPTSFNITTSDVELQPSYTITLVPWLLLAGMIALSVACILTIVLVVLACKSDVFLGGRLLDNVRVAMDLGQALDRNVFEDSLEWSGFALDEWAATNRIRYTMNDVDKEREIGRNVGHRSVIKLNKIS